MADLIFMFIQIFTLLIFARVLVGWMVNFGRMSPDTPLAQTIFNLTEPILEPIRNLLPPTAGFDFSPIIVIIAVQFVGGLLIQMLS
jgi:YggT family protein